MSSDAVENEHTGELAWCFARRPGLSPGAGRPAETKAQRAAARPWRDARADQAARCVEVEARVVDAGGAVTSRLDARASASARRVTRRRDITAARGAVTRPRAFSWSEPKHDLHGLFPAAGNADACVFGLEVTRCDTCARATARETSWARRVE